LYGFGRARVGGDQLSFRVERLAVHEASHRVDDIPAGQAHRAAERGYAYVELVGAEYRRREGRVLDDGYLPAIADASLTDRAASIRGYRFHRGADAVDVHFPTGHPRIDESKWSGGRWPAPAGAGGRSLASEVATLGRQRLHVQ
jgi:hypothetical protein